LPITNPYGLCKNNFDFIRFQETKTGSCTRRQTLDAASCPAYNGLNYNLLNYNVYRGTTGTNAGAIKPNIIYRNIIDKYYYKSNSNFNGSPQFSQVGNVCSCNQMITEVIIINLQNIYNTL